MRISLFDPKDQRACPWVHCGPTFRLVWSNMDFALSKKAEDLCDIYALQCGGFTVTRDKTKVLIIKMTIFLAFTLSYSSKSLAVDVQPHPEPAATLYGPPDPARSKQDDGDDAHHGTKVALAPDDFHDEFKILNKKRRRLDEMEVIFQLLNIGDAVTTIDLVNRPNVREGNPLLGSHPSSGKVIAVKSLIGALHFLTYRRFRSKDVGGGFRFEAISIGIQGAVTGANLRFYF